MAKGEPVVAALITNVRGLSDLAGGQTGENQMDEYLKAAASHSSTVLATILQNLPPTAP